MIPAREKNKDEVTSFCGSLCLDQCEHCNGSNCFLLEFLMAFTLMSKKIYKFAHEFPLKSSHSQKIFMTLYALR